LTRRSVALVILFTLISCSIYWFYWLYVTTDELKRVSGRDELNPGIDLLLSIVTCEVDPIWWTVLLSQSTPPS